MSAASTFAEQRALHERYMAAVNITHILGENPMATTSLFTAISGTTTGRYATPTTLTMDRAVSSTDESVLLYRMKQNTHATELRRLHNGYANAVFRHDFNIPLWRAFSDQKESLREYINEVRRLLSSKNSVQRRKKSKTQRAAVQHHVQ
jgi:hypothetical protein